MKQVGLLHKVFLCFIMIILMVSQVSSLSFIHTNALAGDTVTTIRIVAPNDGDVFKHKEVQVKGIIEEIAGSSTVKVYANSKQVASPPLQSDGSWSANIVLPEGTHTIYAATYDDSLTSNMVSISIDSTPPSEVVIDSPSNGKYTNLPVISGTAEANSIVQLCLDCNLNLTEHWLETETDELGNWSYRITLLAEGEHTLLVRAKDLASNIGPERLVTFHYDRTRPIILPEVYPKQDLTHVALDSVIKLKVTDHSPIDLLTITNSVLLTQNGNNIPGEIEFDPETGEIIFTPTNLLLPSKTYYVMAKPTIRDRAGNYSRPRFWSFTTISDSTLATENPHGKYDSNVNTCKNCHGTHVSTNRDLNNQDYLKEPKEIQNKMVDNYCMACHDGTVAPVPKNMLKAHSHDFEVNLDGSIKGSSCASCHNPHLEWSEHNPNLFQDQFSYLHVKPEGSAQPSLLPIPSYEEPINSKVQLCESCHESDNIQRKTHERVDYRVFQFNKWNTAVGVVEDFELCLRCHNDVYQLKNENIANIEQFYRNLTNEVRKQFEELNNIAFSERDMTAEKRFSGHIVKALDGSPLAGHIPCADCHDTHGSDNIKQLKDELGHQNQTEFKAPEGEWTPVTERAFCLSCHNGSTSLYGVIGKIPDPAKTPEHSTPSSTACSSCHGEGKDALEKARSAAHAPRLPSYID